MNSYKSIKKKNTVQRLITKTVTYLIAVTGGLLSVINLFYPLFENMQISLLLMVVCILLPILAGTREFTELGYDSLADIEKSISNIEDSLQAVEIKLFDDSIPDDHLMIEVDKYIADRISTARNSVYDLVWQYKIEDTRPFIDKSKFVEKELDKRIKEFCGKEGNKYYELIVVSTPNRYYKMMNHIKYGNRYSCKTIGFHNDIMSTNFPKLQFVLIDKEEIIFASSRYGRNICACKSKKMGAILAAYFESAWEHSSTRTIKDFGKKADPISIEHARDYLIKMICERNTETNELLANINEYNTDIEKLKK